MMIAGRSCPGRRSLHEFALAHRQEFAAYQPRDRRPADDRDGDDDAAFDGDMIATSTIAKRSAGIVWKNSVKRINASSIQPP